MIKVGDEVRIREWDDMVKQYGMYPNWDPWNSEVIAVKGTRVFLPEMKRFCGKTFVVTSIGQGFGDTVTGHDISNAYGITLGMVEKIPNKTLKESIVEWIKDYFEAQPHAKGAIIGISGGKDSAVAAALLCEAIGKDKVLGVLMPDGFQGDIAYSYLLVDTLDIKYEVVNIREAYLAITGAMPYVLSYQGSINILPRLRMTTLYALAAGHHYRVCGTGNKSESAVGYFTKWGDGACDFNPLADLTSAEVIQLGKEMGLPHEIMSREPSDGLCGKTDEENLGFSYEDLDRHLSGEIFSQEIEDKIEYNLHKVSPIPVFRKG